MAAPELKEVRIGIIGPSWWVDYWHLPALLRHPRARITGVAGAKDRPPHEVATKFGESVRYFTRASSMLDETHPVGVVVCTPNDLHFPSTMEALERGIHVICEKPLALNAEQAKTMTRAAEEAGLIGMTNFPYRANPCVNAFRRLLAEGAIGDMVHITGEYHGGFGLRGWPGWRGLRERSGAGILGDLGSHLIDLTRYVTGLEFDAVTASLLTLNRKPDGAPARVPTSSPEAGERNDDSCAFIAALSNGSQAILHTSWLAHQGAYHQHQRLEAYGTGGRIEFLATHKGSYLRRMPIGVTEWDTLELEGVTDPSAGLADEDLFRPGRHDSTSTTWRFVEAIANGDRSASPTFADGWRAQQVIDAVVAAGEQRRWVEVDRTGR
ncbi:MAG: Gfo/Idh/MocA family oxidoreductase [Armatimonadetes bacterium]|nr:Gfo/Idh/MocA family oxidoreductase [Armatimonadota bacterium]MDE2206248.1 Gfo/Idh/MocA family oxidoreductase [Armatimonadota bacterium]